MQIRIAILVHCDQVSGGLQPDFESGRAAKLIFVCPAPTGNLRAYLRLCPLVGIEVNRTISTPIEVNRT